jgi:hypothetical protein
MKLFILTITKEQHITVLILKKIFLYTKIFILVYLIVEIKQKL